MRHFGEFFNFEQRRAILEVFKASPHAPEVFELRNILMCAVGYLGKVLSRFYQNNLAVALQGISDDIDASARLQIFYQKHVRRNLTAF